MRAAEILHPFQLEKHAGIGIREDKPFCVGQRKLSVLHRRVRYPEEHIRIHIHLITEKAVRLVAAIFEIGFVLCIAGRIHTVAAADQHNGEPLLAGYPDNPLVAVDQALLAGRELRGELSAAPHLHELVVCPAKADDHRLNRDSLLQRLSAKTLAGRVDQLHLPVYQWVIRTVLQIGPVYFHRSASSS